MKNKLNYQIVETFSLGKNKNQDLNEDGLFINDKLIAVIDGTTDKQNISINNQSGGVVAKNLIIKKLNDFSGEENSTSIIKILIAYLAKEIPLEIYGKISATVIILNLIKKEIIIFGDSKLLIDNCEIDNSKEIDSVISYKRANIIKELLKEGYNEEDLLKYDLSREKIKVDLINQLQYENKQGIYGYGVITNDLKDIDNVESFIKVIPLNNVKEVVMASDGYPILLNSLKRSEYELNKVIRNDPLCYKQFKSTKGVYNGLNSFDDRTYIKIKFN